MKINHGELMHFLEFAWVPVVEIVAGLLIGPWVKRMIEKIAGKSGDKGVLTFVGSSASILIIAISFILAAESIGIKMSNIVALVSALGLGLTLALKGDMANVAGGIQILVTKPFKIGDYIKIESHRGYVTTIELMFITIRTDNGKEVIVPNSTIVSDVLTNYSRYPFLRIKIPFSLPAGSDFPAIKKQAEEILRHNPLLLKDQPIAVTFKAIDEGYVTLDAIGYVTIENHERCKHLMYEELATKLPILLPDHYQVVSSDADDVAPPVNSTRSDSFQRVNSNSQNVTSSVMPDVQGNASPNNNQNNPSDSTVIQK